MVHLVLTSLAGNGAPRFPFDGYLGLTPVVVKGAVLSRIDSDGKPLQALSVSIHVRCYETRLSRFGPAQSNLLADHSAVLWRSPQHPSPGPLGETDTTFRIVVPTDSPGHSTVSFPDYRVFWRVEAAINHPHITGVGTRTIKTAELAIIRYATSAPSRPLVPPPPPYLLSVPASSKPRAPMLFYRITVPESPVGPLDVLSVSVSVRADDPSVAIRSASLTVERRIELRDVAYPASPIPTSLPSNGSTPSLAPSAPNTSRTHLLLPPTPSSPASPEASSAKVSTSIVAGAESGAGRFALDARGFWTRTLALQWPAPRSAGRWALGETLATDLARVSFAARVRLVVSSASGTDSVELAEASIAVAATSDAERRLALARYAARAPDTPPGLDQQQQQQQQQQQEKEKKKTPRSPMPASAPPSVAKIGAGAMARPSVHELSWDVPPKRRKESSDKRGAPRQRAHTSAGARPTTSAGRPHTSAGRLGVGPGAGAGAGALLLRPGTAQATAAYTTTAHVASYVQGVSPPGAAPDGESIVSVRFDTITGETTVRARPRAQAELVRAWEEELARIESTSRRRSEAARRDDRERDGRARRVGPVRGIARRPEDG